MKPIQKFLMLLATMVMIFAVRRCYFGDPLSDCFIHVMVSFTSVVIVIGFFSFLKKSI